MISSKKITYDPLKIITDNKIGVFVSNFKGEILFANKCFAEMLGYTEEELTSVNLGTDIYDNPETRNQLVKLLREKKSVNNFRAILKTSNGKKIYTLINKNIEITTDGEVTFTASVKNITEWIVKEYELKKQINHVKKNSFDFDSKYEDLVNDNRIKTKFLKNTGHEIRTPLTSLIGYLTVLEKKLYSNEDEMSNIVSEAVFSSGVLMDTVNNLLDVSHIEAGEMLAYNELMNLNTELSKVVNFIERNTGYKNLTVKFINKLPETLHGDPIRYRQALLNLIKFGLSADPKESIEILVDYVKGNDDRYRVSTTVKCRKIRLSEEEIEALKKNLNNPAAMYNKEGAQLSLYVCNEFVKSMGGVLLINRYNNGDLDIYFESILTEEKEHKKHTEAKEVSEASTTVISEVPPVKDKKYIDGEKPRILLVEDDAGNRDVEMKILQNAGYFVKDLASGKDALQEIAANDYDIVLMDLAMEGIDGIEATKAIRSMPEPKGNIPVIAVTAHCSMEDREKCIQAGMNDYISKPINFKYLKMTIEQWISKKNNEGPQF